MRRSRSTSGRDSAHDREGETRLTITKGSAGSALEIPQNTDDAWNQELGFQGQCAHY